MKDYDKEIERLMAEMKTSPTPYLVYLELKIFQANNT